MVMPIDKSIWEYLPKRSISLLSSYCFGKQEFVFLYPYYSDSSPRPAKPFLLLEELKEMKLHQKFLESKKAEMEQHISHLVIKVSRNA